MNTTRYRAGLVSVVTPTYNSADFLREAIQSALAQTYGDLEIIVVDDGSTDHTQGVCLDFKDKIQYVYQQNDGTRGNGARARAILESKGEWVALLDHDDLWAPTKIEEQVAAIRRDERAGIIFTGADIIDAQGRSTGESFSNGPEGDVFHQLLAGDRYCASSALVRRTAIDFVRANAPEGDFLTRMTHKNNDTDLWIRIARFYEVIHLDKALTKYRYHGANDSADKTRLWTTDLEMLAGKMPYLHEDCRECARSFRSGRRNLKRRLAIAHFDQFLGATLRNERSLGDLADALRTDFPFILDARRFCVMWKYLFRNVSNSAKKSPSV